MLGFRWLYPGMRLKRWFFLIALSVVVLIVGFTGIMSQHITGVHYRPPLVIEIEEHLKHLKFVDYLFFGLGTWGIWLGVRRAIRSVLTVLIPERERDFIN